MNESNEDSKYRWLWVSLGFGSIMFLIMGVLEPSMSGDELTADFLIRKACIWLAFGFVFGIGQHLWRKRSAGNV